MADEAERPQDKDREKWDALAARIEQAEQGARAKRGYGLAADDAPVAVGAMRIGADLVAAVMAGALLGWVFDSVLGTKPWGLLAFLFGGFVAGFWNVVRALSASGGGPKKKEDPHGNGLAD